MRVLFSITRCACDCVVFWRWGRLELAACCVRMSRSFPTPTNGHVHTSCNYPRLVFLVPSTLGVATHSSETWRSSRIALLAPPHSQRGAFSVIMTIRACLHPTPSSSDASPFQLMHSLVTLKPNNNKPKYCITTKDCFKTVKSARNFFWIQFTIDYNFQGQTLCHLHFCLTCLLLNKCQQFIFGS